jgi:hypothetical protein
MLGPSPILSPEYRGEELGRGVLLRLAKSCAGRKVSGGESTGARGRLLGARTPPQKCRAVSLSTRERSRFPGSRTHPQKRRRREYRPEPVMHPDSVDSLARACVQLSERTQFAPRFGLERTHFTSVSERTPYLNLKRTQFSRFWNEPNYGCSETKPSPDVNRGRTHSPPDSIRNEPNSLQIPSERTQFVIIVDQKGLCRG